ncbi:MAG: hypothetical protein NC314_13115 [Roseburia sp.]|nr:hypothetical protein [Roseburia sp.]MCM1243777.1 hypothetical protein [Roseburia sp.]
MKFISLIKTKDPHNKPHNPDAEKETLKAEFKSAFRAGEGRLGETHFFYRYFINVKFIPWDKICKAYLRVESGESGEFLLKEFYLMLYFDDLGKMEEAKLRFEREENARYILEYLTEHYPHVEVGYKKKRDQL